VCLISQLRLVCRLFGSCEADGDRWPLYSLSLPFVSPRRFCLPYAVHFFLYLSKFAGVLEL
jgi:hypothetical protein